MICEWNVKISNGNAINTTVPQKQTPDERTSFRYLFEVFEIFCTSLPIPSYTVFLTLDFLPSFLWLTRRRFARFVVSHITNRVEINRSTVLIEMSIIGSKIIAFLILTNRKHKYYKGRGWLVTQHFRILPIECIHVLTTSGPNVLSADIFTDWTVF